MCVYSQNLKVRLKAHKFISKVFLSQMNLNENFAGSISLYYYNLIYETLYECYNDFSIKDQKNSVRNLLELVLLLIGDDKTGSLQSK